MKYRLVGAVILIGFGVIVLPWLLGGEGGSPGQPAEQAAQAGGKGADDNTKVFVSRITPIGGATPPVLTVPAAKSPQPDSGKPASAPVEAPPAVKKPGVVTTAKPEVAGKKPRKSPAATANTATAKAAPQVTRGWVVRIGTFSKIDNAKRVMASLRTKGFAPSSGKIKTKNGMATRVWVGPYAKRVQAARVRTRIERVTGEKGLITPYP